MTPCERQFLTPPLTTATLTPSSAYSTTAVIWLLFLCAAVAASIAASGTISSGYTIGGY